MGPLQKIIIGSVTLMLLEWGCNQPSAPDCLQIGGAKGKISKNITPFTQLILQDHLAYFLHPSSQYYIEIVGPKNLLNEIDLKYNQQSLIISNQNTCNVFRRYNDMIEVHVYAPEFPSIIDQSTLEITTPDTLHQSYFHFRQEQASSQTQILLHCDSVTIEMPYGVGDINVKGICHTARIYNGSWGIIDARQLKNQLIYCNQSAIQDVFIQNGSYTYVSIENKGNVYYRGTPNDLDLISTGEGKFLPIP